MTRYQILKETRRLIQNGYLPTGTRIICLDSANQPVSVVHPNASVFTLWTAIQRAIFNTTGDHFDQRERLYKESTDAVIKHFNGRASEADYYLTTAPVAEVVRMIDQILAMWDNPVEKAS